MITVTTVKKMVVPMEDQNCDPQRAGRAGDVPAPLEQPVGVVGEAGEAALDEQPGRRVQAGVLLEGHDDRPDHRVADDDEQDDDASGRSGTGRAGSARPRAPSALFDLLRGLAGLGLAGLGISGCHWASRRTRRPGGSAVDRSLGRASDRWGRAGRARPHRRSQPVLAAAVIAACMSVNACSTGFSPLIAA